MPTNPQDEAGRGWQVKRSIAAPKEAHGRHRPCGLRPQRRTPISVDTPQRPRACPSRLIDAPHEKLFRAWTEPEVLKQWFTPSPFSLVPSRKTGVV